MEVLQATTLTNRLVTYTFTKKRVLKRLYYTLNNTPINRHFHQTPRVLPHASFPPCNARDEAGIIERIINLAGKLQGYSQS